jgi:hypothetical protein
MRKVSRADETYDINFRTADAWNPWRNPIEKVPIDPRPASEDTLERQNRSVIILPPGHDADDVLRHDKGHDDWHRSEGVEPCTSEADCTAKVKRHKSNRHKASVRTADAWPSKIDHAHHIASMEELLEHHVMGERWHNEHGDSKKAMLHAFAADTLRNAIHACSEAAEGRSIDDTPFEN